ncbi:sarcosine oxidase subunit beta [Rhizobium skierniewicense]|uniref:Sarcosine oxidase subunit beta n=1 Tax=Rhizobium skierniewicense TaxID=984260 RepID=A0A7W6C827_9HYPH|nr:MULTISPECIES: FAD-dependent oxidoreductase [Rhizobium/Agrobacterium group]MBB3947427.1 sarcosine oxidase subunit beta [Rhizobium skierniewicense]NSY52177.1 FAD-binding oxidoreductase [Agrobacterium tumefaciens]NTF34893.1 FAD-binding oxidoreductase [Rhizobium skierniewicense]WCK17295.1 FAD-dependent oxidoreductase [Agrobacterium tumefaciens]
MSGNALDTIVIGGGLHGLSAAMNLARAGKTVAILERSWVGRHSSGATAAGVRTLNRDLAEIPISLEAMDMWHNIERIVGDSCGFHAYGQMSIAEKPEHLTVLEKRLAKIRSAGYDHEELIDRAELLRLVPSISPHCMGALIARNDGAADPHRTLKAFRQATEAAGVTIYEGAGVIAIEHAGADWRVRTETMEFIAPTVVNAAGAWAVKIAAMVGDDIQIGHKASMMIVTERIAPLLKPVVSVVGRPLSFKQSDQGTLVIGGGLQGRADLDAQRSFVNFKELSKGARAATDLFPIVGQLRIVRTWAGMEAMTADHLPIIGPSPNASGVFHSFGYSGHGFQLVPVLGAIMTDLIVHGGTNRVIEPFSAKRLIRKEVRHVAH